MNKTQVKELRNELARIIIELEKLRTKKTALVKTLAPDFEENEAVYRTGVRTEAGLLFRRPSWVFDAKPVIEVG